MELKHVIIKPLHAFVSLLIELYGIETCLSQRISQKQGLLIELYGIETKIYFRIFPQQKNLLIELYGIETLKFSSFGNTFLPF